MLKIIEEEALGDEKFFGGEDIGLLDLVLGWFAHWFDIIEELVGVKVLDASKLPRLHAWTENFKEVPVSKKIFLIAANSWPTSNTSILPTFQV